MLGPWDVSLFRWINSGWSSPILDPVFWFFSLGIKETYFRIGLGILFVVLLFLGARLRGTAILALLSFPLANELSDLFKNGFPALRPFSQLTDVVVLGNPMTSSGTMSAHAANMATIATVFWIRAGWKWGLPWAIVALLTGISRVYVGAHFPSQVIFGWTGGIVSGMVVAYTWRAIRELRKKKTISSSDA